MQRKRVDGYSQKEIDYLSEIGHGRSNKEITRMFNKKFNKNKTVDAIIGTKYRYGIRSYTKKTYTEEQIDYLREITPDRTSKEITKMFNEKFNDNRTETSIKSIRHENGILIGNTGRFQKGNSPNNILPIGTEILRDDGYLYVKIEEPNKWKQKHRIIYEKHHGVVPDKHVVLFGDGNRLNFDIDNLICVSRKQLLGLNQYDLIQDNAGLTKTGIIIADLKHKIKEVCKK